MAENGNISGVEAIRQLIEAQKKWLPIQPGQGENSLELGSSVQAIGDHSHASGISSKAISRNAFSHGFDNIAGGRGFRITTQATGEVPGTGIYTLTSVNGIEAGQNYIVRLSSVSGTLTGKILEVDASTKIILVDNYDSKLVIEGDNYNFEEDQDYFTYPSVSNYLCILGHPELGDINIGFNAVTFGEYNIASERGAVSFGRLNKSLGQYAFTEGYLNEANYSSHAEGHRNKASGLTSHAEGREGTASGYAAHSEGARNTASGEAAHAEGCQTVSSGNYSHSEGNNTVATGPSSHAEGYKVNAIGSRSHAEGDIEDSKNGDGSYKESSFNRSVTVNEKIYVNDGHAHGSYSHREGRNTSTYGGGSHAEGIGAMSIGANSHAEGYKSTAGGSAAHAEGSSTSALGNYSHAGGLGTIATAEAQSAIGKYNKEDTNALFIVGNGSNKAPSNAFTVDKDGRATLGADPEEAMHAVTKQYFDDAIGDIDTALDAILAIQEELIPTPVLITFTILNRDYTAIKDMTWEQWCDSKYNTDGYYIDPDFPLKNAVVDANGDTICEYVDDSPDHVLHASEIIIPNGIYGWE